MHICHVKIILLYIKPIALKLMYKVLKQKRHGLEANATMMLKDTYHSKLFESSSTLFLSLN